jgi:hypothetical protein
VLARYEHLENLQRAIASLEAHGVDGDDLALVGEGALEVEAEAGRTPTGVRLFERTAVRIAIALVTATLAGALVGAVFVGTAILVFSGIYAKGWVFVLVVCWFAAAGSVVGLYVGFFRTLGFSEAVPLTYAPEPRHSIWLAVYGSAEDVEPRVAATDPVEMMTSPPVRTMHPDEAKSA